MSKIIDWTKRNRIATNAILGALFILGVLLFFQEVSGTGVRPESVEGQSDRAGERPTASGVVMETVTKQTPR